ncbi:MAG: ABC transporter substrate-binding protein [Candidatus Aminicenantes bacterium]|nr:ABC transporter substrate-binding protein [Candidatus Aminicenantes bacterium]
MKKIWIKIGIVVIAALAIVLIITQTRKEPEEIKIGVVAPLTGPIAVYGENVRDGVLLAVDEINKNGGVNGTSIKIILEDEGAGPQASVNAVRKLISIDHVQTIIGPATSAGLLASAPIAEKEHVILFSPSSTSDNVRDAGDYIFRNRASTSQEATVFAKYIMEELGLKKLSILRANADYAKSFADVCKKIIAEKGGVVLNEEMFAEGASDYRSQLTKIKALNPEGIFIVGVPVELGNILRQIKEIGIKAQLFSNTIDSPEIFKIAKGAEEGLTFVTTFYDPKTGDEKIEEFDKKFMERFGRASHIFGANAYDAIYILKTVIKDYGYKGEKIKEGLYKLKDFKGAGGNIEFDEKGDLRFTKVAVKKIVGGKFTFVREIQR